MSAKAAALEPLAGHTDRLSTARVLLELGEPFDAERDVAQLLEERPDDLDALSLLAKIKHLKGELSHAIACWAQIQVLAPPAETALLQLQAILSLVTDPERGAGDFLAFAQLQRLHTPAAYLDLEDAFTDLAARRFDEARHKCLRSAARHRRDRDTHKLTTLAAAWVCELSGRVGEACELLESLGGERGFETDLDRVLMLARLYETDGGAERLEAALHIWRFFERRSDRIEIPCRLGVLQRRLGRSAQAAEYERRYEEAFRRRMHRPSFEELVGVAARRYLPLHRLLALPLHAPRVPLEPPRAKAIALALTGERAAARALLSGLHSTLDRKYLADLLLLDGDVSGAEAAYLEALADDPQDLRVLAFLLERHARAPSERVVAALQGRLLAEVRVTLDAAVQTHPLRPSLWRQRATVARLGGRDDEAARFDARARAIEQARQRDASPVGRVLSAAVYRYLGRSKGLIHEVWADREPAPRGEGGTLKEHHIFGNVNPEMRQAVRSTFLSVREYAKSKFPHLTQDLYDYSYSFKVTKEDEPTHGLSVGLPAAVAFLSVFLQRPVPQTLALSGVVVADAHDVLSVHPVGDTEHKVKAAYHRNLRALVLPAANRRELAANPRIPAAIREELVRYALDFDSAVALVFGEDVFASGEAGADGLPESPPPP